MPLLVDAPIKVLEKGQVRREHVLHDVRVHCGQCLQSSHRALEQQNCEVGGILADPGVRLRAELVASGRQPDRPFPVNMAFGIDIAKGQREWELCPHAHRSGGRTHGATRCRRSQTIVTSSISTSLAPDFSPPKEIFEHQAFSKW